MSYVRVIPRDLFNEANLLKCYGRLWILLEKANNPHVELVHDTDEVSEFHVEMDVSDGSISIENVVLFVGDKPVRLFRPMNSRDSWPLFAQIGDEPVLVFDSNGELSAEFIQLFT